MYYVFYGKVVEDKEDGVYLAGVHFGGLAADRASADRIARECVNTVKGGTIIPKIFPVEGRHLLLPLMRDAVKKFTQLERQMIQAEDIMDRSVRRK